MYTFHSLAAIFVLTAFGTPVLVAQHPGMTPGMTHEQHMAALQKELEVEQRGAAAMGFDQNKTLHHFVLTANGGRIEVRVRDASDAESRAAIRTHLRQIASDFAIGRFDAPFATHGETPPGVSTMRRQRATIAYAYRDSPDGGSVTIATTRTTARNAVHAFLRYQIREHSTGDPMTVKP